MKVMYEAYADNVSSGPCILYCTAIREVKLRILNYKEVSCASLGSDNFAFVVKN